MSSKPRLKVEPDWAAVWAELGSDSDRAVAIVGQAVLEQDVAGLLRSYFVDNSRVADQILGGHKGPILSLHKSAAMAYSLGLITSEQLEDLQAINAIRNHFAHHLHGASFEDRSVAHHNETLEPYKRFKAVPEEATPRDRFAAAVSALSIWLLQKAARTKHRDEFHHGERE